MCAEQNNSQHHPRLGLNSVFLRHKKACGDQHNYLLSVHPSCLPLFPADTVLVQLTPACFFIVGQPSLQHYKQCGSIPRQPQTFPPCIKGQFLGCTQHPWCNLGSWLNLWAESSLKVVGKRGTNQFWKLHCGQRSVSPHRQQSLQKSTVGDCNWKSGPGSGSRLLLCLLLLSL